MCTLLLFLPLCSCIHMGAAVAPSDGYHQARYVSAKTVEAKKCLWSLFGIIPLGAMENQTAAAMEKARQKANRAGRSVHLGEVQVDVTFEHFVLVARNCTSVKAKVYLSGRSFGQLCHVNSDCQSSHCVAKAHSTRRTCSRRCDLDRPNTCLGGMQCRLEAGWRVPVCIAQPTTTPTPAKTAKPTVPTP